MATIGSLVVNLVANTSQFSGGLKKGAAEANRFKSAMSGVSSVASKFGLALGGVGLAVAGGNFLKSSIHEAMEAERVMKQLQTVIKSTGGAAGFTAQELSKYAEELQKVTTYGDDTTKSAMAVLATFTNIKGGVFLDATKAAQDMSTALGQDLQASVIQLGKALNDPIKGITALSRVGVSFTEQQKAQIKALVESGDTMKAQKLILAELSTEFGGSAAAAADTYSGKIKQMTNDWEDFKQSVGETVLPAVGGTLKTTASWYDSYKAWWGGEGGSNFLNMTSSPDYSKATAYLKDVPKVANGLGFGQAYNGLGAGLSPKESKPEPLAKATAKRFGEALDEAFKAQFVGTNRADMFKNAREWDAKRLKAFGQLITGGFGQTGGSTNLAAFNSLRDGGKAATKPIPVVLKDRQLGAIDPGFRGSQSHLEAIIKQKGGMLGESFADLQKQQVRHLAAIERNTGGGGAGVGVV